MNRFSSISLLQNLTSPLHAHQYNVHIIKVPFHFKTTPLITSHSKTIIKEDRRMKSVIKREERKHGMSTKTKEVKNTTLRLWR